MLQFPANFSGIWRENTNVGRGGGGKIGGFPGVWAEGGGRKVTVEQLEAVSFSELQLL